MKKCLRKFSELLFLCWLILIYSNLGNIGVNGFYVTNFTNTPITIPSGTKTCIGYFTFSKTGLFLVKITIRWSGTTKSTLHSILINGDNSTAPVYDLCAYDNSNNQLSPQTTFVQQFLTYVTITETPSKGAIWVYHNKGSSCTIDVNWSSARYIH